MTPLRGRIDSGGWIMQLRDEQKSAAAKLPSADDLIDQVFLRTVGRPPKEKERKDARELFASAKGPVDGARTLLWTMLNTKEFIVNH